jgi:methionyl-tRNA formyltransferase
VRIEQHGDLNVWPFTAQATRASGMKRIAVFTGELTYAVRKAVAELSAAFPAVEWLIVEHAAKKSPRQLVRNQWRHLRRNGWRWLPHLARLVAERRSRPPRRPDAPGAQYTWERIALLPAVRHVRVANIHAEATIQTVRAFAPDLGIALNAPILRPALFTLPTLGTINLHKAKLPDYRGLPPAFWECFHSEREVGCTVHRVDARLDTGPILVERRVPITPHATVRALQLTLDEVGIDLMREAIRRLKTGDAQWTPQPSGGRTFTMPTLRQQRMVAVQRPVEHHAPSLRGYAKNTTYWSYSRLLAPWARPYRAARHRQRIVVLLYHRVNDDMRDSLTVGIEQFHQQMAWVSRHCTPVDLQQLVLGVAPRDSVRPLVAVTFDDGYRDNYDNAVPILLREQVPATFFVSTGLMDNNVGFAHDWQRRGGTLPTMSWGQLAHMRDLGFGIGSHTATHINCGRTPDDVVRAELIASRDALHTRLGLRDIMFAYPFGRREDVTPSVRAMVKELGFTACLSAYGGTIDGPVDPYHIPREGIDHGFNLIAFRAKVEGFSSERASRAREPIPLAATSRSEST